MEIKRTQAEEQGSFRKVEKWVGGDVELAIHRFEGLPPYYFIRYMAEPEFAPAVQITLVNAKENEVRIIFDVEGKVHYQDSPMVRKAIKEMEEFCAACEAAQLFKIIKD